MIASAPSIAARFRTLQETSAPCLTFAHVARYVGLMAPIDYVARAVVWVAIPPLCLLWWAAFGLSLLGAWDAAALVGGVLCVVLAVAVAAASVLLREPEAVPCET